MDAPSPVELFFPPVRDGSRSTWGEPTHAQRQGWPAITAGQDTLVLAPTASGKTLAAFLACLDGLWRQPLTPDPSPAGRCREPSGTSSPARLAGPTPRGEGSKTNGVRVLYISPLKALNNDIYRNLQVPLEGVTAAARR